MTTVLASWDGVAPAQAGPLGLIVILLLGVAVYFLYKSMNKQLRKIPESFDPPVEKTDATAARSGDGGPEDGAP